MVKLSGLDSYWWRKCKGAVMEKKTDIILLDIKMPGDSGIKVLQDIKAIDKDAKVIMMTAVKEDAMIELAMQYGAIDYITKPFSLEHLGKNVMSKVVKYLFWSYKRF